MTINNKKTMLNRIVIIFVFIVLFSACKQANQVSDKKINKTEPYSGNVIHQQLKEMYHRFPSPGEMFKRLEESSLQYQSGLVNDVNNYDRYLDSKSQALNLGVYSADLAYLTLVEKHEDAATFVEAVYSLSDRLRVSAAFDRTYIIRIQKNIANVDSLKVISEETYSRLIKYLESNDDELTFAQISIGGYIETMYLSISLMGNYSEENSFLNNVSEQKYVLNNILKFAQQVTPSSNLTECIALLKPIKDIYDELDVEVEGTSVKKEESGKLLIKGGEENKMTEEQFVELKAAVYDVREKITEI